MARAVIMGVAGSGKSSVGLALAARVGAIYLDGDDLHPPSNVAKMSAGVPLTDADRSPWLIRIGETLHAARGPILIGCSALKRPYRDLIRQGAGGPVVFVHLVGSRSLIKARMSARQGHFMPTSLLDSQFADLQPLNADEAGFDTDIGQPLPSVIAEAEAKLTAMQDWHSPTS